MDYSLGQKHVLTLKKAGACLRMQVDQSAFSEASISTLLLQPENAKKKTPRAM